ncbi:MAG: hypothetical protein IPO81_20000 [Kouleothrix sp.]|nr:hypothetical protein [Kouleothrix sp.]
MIDQGSDELNMPTYNGGLFSPQTEGGQFLDTYAIPDRFLARGLDRLARDVDARTRALVFIDFKSLGVRQLGSIYEGLLEFKLRIAAEKLAVTKEKGKEGLRAARAGQEAAGDARQGARSISKTIRRSARRPAATTRPITSSSTSSSTPSARCSTARSSS